MSSIMILKAFWAITLMLFVIIIAGVFLSICKRRLITRNRK
jgi:hypothetical protein